MNVCYESAYKPFKVSAKTAFSSTLSGRKASSGASQMATLQTFFWASYIFHHPAFVQNSQENSRILFTCGYPRKLVTVISVLLVSFFFPLLIFEIFTSSASMFIQKSWRKVEKSLPGLKHESLHDSLGKLVPRIFFLGSAPSWLTVVLLNKPHWVWS